MAVTHFRSSSEVTQPKAELLCRAVTAPGDLLIHHRIRHAVFVTEQGLFAVSDRDDLDDLDDHAEVRHVVGYVDGIAAGTVRLYPVPAELPGEKLWKGDRLAVLPGHRHAGLGGPLVHYAVATAASLGGDRMVAWIQPGNVVYFRRLGWTAVGEPMPYVGVPHQKMTIGLG